MIFQPIEPTAGGAPVQDTSRLRRALVPGPMADVLIPELG
jgi:hypothetical protein